MRVAILKLLIFVFVAGCRAPDAGVLPVGEGRGREVLEERHERERGKARLERVGGRLAGVVSVAGGDLAVWRVRQRGREMRADARAQEWCVAAGYRGDCGERFWRAYAAARPVPERAAWRSKHPGDLERAEALGVVGR
jgi:hypothetical protein